MSSTGPAPQDRYPEEVRLEEIGHPRGTLVIVLLFGLAFALAWFAMYVFQFLGRGAPHS